jgi:hypothetical protein
MAPRFDGSSFLMTRIFVTSAPLSCLLGSNVMPALLTGQANNQSTKSGNRFGGTQKWCSGRRVASPAAIHSRCGQNPTYRQRIANPKPMQRSAVLRPARRRTVENLRLRQHSDWQAWQRHRQGERFWPRLFARAQFCGRSCIALLWIQQNLWRLRTTTSDGWPTILLV